MKNQVLFSSKDKSKRLKCRLLQFLFGALRVKKLKPELYGARSGRMALSVMNISDFFHVFQTILGFLSRSTSLRTFKSKENTSKTKGPDNANGKER